MTIRNHLQAVIAAILVMLLLCSTAFGQTEKITNISGQIYESEEQSQEIDIQNVKRLIFSASGHFSGSVVVKATDDNHRLKHFQHYKARSLDEAEEFAEFLSLDARRSGEYFMVDAKAKRKAPWMGTDQSARMEIVLIVPKLIEIEITAKDFDITVNGPFTTVEVLNEFGRIKVSDVTEKLRLITENSRVTLSDLMGDIEVSTSNNLIRAREIDAKGGRAIFNNEYGPIEISRFTGALECATSYATIDLRGIRLTAGKSNIRTSYSAIDAEIIEMDSVDLYMASDFSNVEVTLPEDVRAEFDLNVDKGGRIDLGGILVTPVDLSRERLLAYSDNPDSKVEVTISGIGTVNVKGKKFYTSP